MIYRLRYCNKDGIEARVDIQKGDATPIYTVEGTSEPFVLFYNNDKGDKSGSFRSSGADINIYETSEFNIDELKTSNETEISVKYYINNILNWSGFVIPDFFSETITGGRGVVSMVASDRLGTLKGATLSGLSAKVSNRALAEACLAQTGLSLPLYTMADFTGDGTNIFNSEVLSQRIIDTKGRSVSCYDILSSILEETNSLIVQRNGAWYIVNKLQLEAGVGNLYSAPTTSSAWVENTVSFDKVSVGARRTITPVAATVGVYHEHGGGRLHPDNYDFSEGNTGWVASGGFPFTIVNNQIVGYTRVNNVWTVNFGDADKNRMQINKIYEGPFSNTDLIAYVSNTFPVITESDTSVNVEIDISVTGRPRTTARAIVIADNGTNKLAFNPSQGAFEPYDPQRYDIMGYPVFFINLTPEGEYLGNERYNAATKSIKYSATLEATNVQDYNISIRFYGTDSYNARVIPIFVNFASVRFSNTAELPKGNILKTTQGANYTKDHEIPTVLWGDYLTSGLNGYFYEYPIDDTSSLYRPTGELHSRWTAYGDPETLPLLQHITRQKARMFSVAHDLLSTDIATSTFDPLSIFVDCDNTRYVVVSARFDFLRSNVSVELEEVAYDNTILKRDFIYSYFGEGEDTIKSIGGIAGGGGGTGGGGMTSEQLAILNNLASWWKLDEENDAIYSDLSVYSKKEISAYGVGSGTGGGGGTGYDRLDAWADYDSTKSGWVLSALLGVDLNTRLSSVESGSATSIVTTGTGNAITSISKSGNVITANKGSKFAELGENGLVLASQLPSYVDDVLEFATLANFPTTGETGKIYVAIDTNLTYRWTGTTYVEISKSLALGETSSTAYRGDRGKIAYEHSQTEHQTIINGIGFVKANGKTLSYDNTTYEPSFTKNTAFNKNFGTTAGTVAQGNDSRIINGQTAYDWGNHASAGYALNSALTAHINKVDNPHSVTKSQVGLGNVDNVKQATKTEFDTHTANSTIHITSIERTNWNDANSKKHTHSNKSVIDALTQGNIDVLSKLSIDANGDLKIDANAYATGELSAYGVGSGTGGGTGVTSLAALTDVSLTTPANGNVLVYNGTHWVNLPQSAIVPDLSAYAQKTYVDTKIAALVDSSPATLDTLNELAAALGNDPNFATTITNLIAGKENAITAGTTSQYYRGDKTWQTLNTSVVPEGNNLYFTNARVKAYGDTLYSPLGHTHTIAQITGLQGALDSKATQSDISTAVNNLEIGGRNLALNSTENTKGYSGNPPYLWSQLIRLSEKLIVGQKYTFSIGNIEGAEFDYISLRDSSSGRQDVHGIIGFTPNREGLDRLYIYYKNYPESGSVTVSNIKLEKGNKATDWTPAPEDQVSDWSVTDVNSFAFIKNKPTQLSQFTDNIGVASHIANTSNPHNVTKAQVGLGNVDNTADSAKNVLSATKLTTARTINGTSFNGSASITTANWGTARNIGIVNSDGTGTAVATSVNGSANVNLKLPETIKASLTGNASTATKLQTARTIAGVSFDGSANIAIPFANLSSKPNTLEGYGITDGALKSLTLTAGNGLTGGGTLEANRTFALGTPSTLTAASTNAVTSTSHTHAITTTTVGAPNTIVATDASGGVRGNIIRIGSNWTLELSGTELVFKYNGVIKQRMLSDGSIVAVGEVTAFGTTS